MSFRVRSPLLWLTKEFKRFDPSYFSPRKEIHAATKELVFWVSMAFVLVWLAGRDALPGHEYLCGSINEGIGPRLWNVIGTFGVFFLCMTLVIPSASLAWLANMIFKNVYSLGCLSLGLLFSMWIFKLDLAYLDVWQDWALQTWFVSAFVTILLMNLVVWYLSWLTDAGGRRDLFLNLLSQMDIKLRIFISLFLVVLVIAPLQWLK